MKNNQINLLAAYNYGRIDALLGEASNRFTAKPWSKRSAVPAGHVGCTKWEEANWSEIRASYIDGYRSTKANLVAPAVLAKPTEDN